MSELLYCYETWKTSQTIEQKLASVKNKCLRRLLKTKWNTFHNNQEVQRANTNRVKNIEKKMEVFGPCSWNAANENIKADVVLETSWEKKRRTPKRNAPTNHQEKHTPWNVRQMTWKEWLPIRLDGAWCSLPCVAAAERVRDCGVDKNLADFAGELEPVTALTQLLATRGELPTSRSLISAASTSSWASLQRSSAREKPQLILALATFV